MLLGSLITALNLKRHARVHSITEGMPSGDSVCRAWELHPGGRNCAQEPGFMVSCLPVPIAFDSRRVPGLAVLRHAPMEMLIIFSSEQLLAKENKLTIKKYKLNVQKSPGTLNNQV